MVKSDSLSEEDMDKLELSSDSTDSKKTKKRPKVVDSEDEATDLPTKKGAASINQQKMPNNFEAVTDKTDEEDNQVQNKLLKQENGNKSSSNKENCIMDKTIIVEKEKEDSSSGEAALSISTSENKEDIGITESDKTLNKKEETKDKIKKEYISKNRTIDTEVVEGLELSVECASEKEEPSSESENENNAKPRPKTIIVKAEPNESELECSLSEGENFDSQEATNILKTKTEKRKKRDSQTSSNKLKFNESDDSQDNKEYSPQTKKTNTLSTPKRSTKYSISRKRQSKDVRRDVRKKSTEHTSDNENLEATSTGEIKKEMKVKAETEEELSEKESSISNTESNNDSVNEESPMKGKRKRRNNVRPEDNSKIQKLKKYLKVAGIRVKNYNNLWADCNTNVAKINRLKKLLEDNGVTGRPTLEKCKLVRQKKERIKEVSELDTSNIISEGRVTRTRRNMTNTEKMSTDMDTSTHHQETRNIFKRIRTVVDSDSE